MADMINKTQRLIKATVVSSTLMPSNAEALSEDDAFDFGSDTYTPPYDLSSLLKFPEFSNILGECIDAYKNNITGFGWEIVPIIDTQSIGYDKSLYEKALQQKEEAELLFKYCNYRSSFTSLTKKMIDNRERNGNGYLEVITNIIGSPCGFEFVSSSKVRICKPIDSVNKTITVVLKNGSTKEYVMPVKFYRYVLNDNGRKVYFKEYGDPRIMNKRTGQYAGKDEKIELSEQASSLLHFKIESIYSPYGVPRFIGKTPAIIGSRRSEELNIQYFENGRIVPAAIIVENGQLSQEAYNSISQLKGNDMAFKFLLLESEGFKDSGDDIIQEDNKKQSNVKVEIKPLTELIQQDGLFQEYDKNNRDKIRSSFRIPPIYTGESQDYNKSTAQTARAVAEALVFEPERQETAEPFNRILSDMGYNLVVLRFNAPKLTDKYELSKALLPYIKSGVATPNVLVEALGDLLGRKINPIEEEWGDVPMEIALKRMELEKIINTVANSVTNTSTGEGTINLEKADVVQVLKEVLYQIKKVAENEQ